MGHVRHLQRPLCLLGLLLLSLVSPGVLGVKRTDFKTCAQSGFCKRNRALADRAAESDGSQWTSPYSVTDAAFSKGTYTARIGNALYPNISFSLRVDFVQHEIARLRIDEIDGLHKRYDEAAHWALVREPDVDAVDAHYDVLLANDRSSIKYGRRKGQEIVVEHDPIRITFSREKQPYVVLNERGLFNIEHHRQKTPAAARAAEQEPDLLVQDPGSATTDPGVVDVPVPGGGKFTKFLDANEEGMWEESFGGNRDSKPRGPESVGMDISFPGYEHVFGIPEHSGPLALRTTRGGPDAFEEPYRLYNLDVFQYEPDSPMALYGAIPFMQAHRAGSSAGVFWLSGAETWIDIEKKATGRVLRSKTESVTTHWFSESGIVDLFVFNAPTPTELMASFSSLTGTTSMPQYFAIGHHQCRWNYVNQEDVLEVSKRFDEADIPMDVVWLDIEYAEEHMYFVWDRRFFPEPEKMQDALAARGRQLVTIIDPHIKRADTLYVYKEAQDLDILAKSSQGVEFQGQCWTGSSSWVDFFNPKSWEWWFSMFKYDKYKGSRRNMFIWNDMNEPSVFSGPEITMPKDNIHYGDWEHRDVHNINGMIYHNLTALALVHRDDPPRRPFVLSRAFFAGSQRVSAIWTGDNMGTWEHLKTTIAMILANGVGGMAFNGADVGGFFGDPQPDYLVRWYQLACLGPFFRAHAHIDTKRREPYLLDQPYQGYIRDAIRLRYALLPAIYTAFREANQTGMPIARSQFMVFPDDTNGFTVDDQYWVGSSGLLLHPAVQYGAEKVDVYLGGEQPYYNYFDYSLLPPIGRTTVPAELDTIPLFLLGGSIVPRYDVIRRAAPLHLRDPITLVIALDSNGQTANGHMYLDDGDSYLHERGDYLDRQFSFAPLKTGRGFGLSNMAYTGSAGRGLKSLPVPEVDAIVILGLADRPSCIRDVKGKSLPSEWQPGLSATAAKRKGGVGRSASALRVERVGAPLDKDWTIELSSTTSADCDIADSPVSPRHATLQSPLCPPNYFRCENKGHQPSCLLISRVNDGICDEECCDGSDETDGRVACPNTCKAANKAFKAAAEEQARKERVGAKMRAEYAAFGARERIAVGLRVTQSESSIGVLEADEQRLRAVLEQTEARRADDIEQKKSTPLYLRLVEYQAAIKSLRGQRNGLREQIGDVSAMMAELKDGYNPNNQDMAVKHAVEGFETWQRTHGYLEAQVQEDDAESEGASDAVAQDAENAPAVSDEDLDVLETYDPLELLESSGESRVGHLSDGPSLLFRLEEYIPAAWRTHYDYGIEWFVNVLSSFGILHPSSRRDCADATGERPDISRARKAHDDAVNALRDERNKLEENKGILDQDWGTEWEWKKLDGTCMEKDTGDYIYEICLFKDGKQKSKSGYGSTVLGHFSGWHPSAEQGTPDYYSKQVYSGGQRCWNGPERSVELDITCGTSNALLSVLEPEKCTYLFKITSPAVCTPPAGQGKTEL